MIGLEQEEQELGIMVVVVDNSSRQIIRVGMLRWLGDRVQRMKCEFLLDRARGGGRGY